MQETESAQLQSRGHNEKCMESAKGKATVDQENLQVWFHSQPLEVHLGNVPANLPLNSPASYLPASAGVMFRHC